MAGNYLCIIRSQCMYYMHTKTNLLVLMVMINHFELYSVKVGQWIRWTNISINFEYCFWNYICLICFLEKTGTGEGMSPYAGIRRLEEFHKGRERLIIFMKEVVAQVTKPNNQKGRPRGYLDYSPTEGVTTV